MGNIKTNYISERGQQVANISSILIEKVVLNASGTVVKNPLRPITPSSVFVVGSSGLPVNSFSWKVDGENIVFTASYAPPLGAISVSKSSSQTLTPNVSTGVVYTAQDWIEGNGISWNGDSKLYFAYDGKVDVRHENMFEARGGGTYRTHHINIDGSGSGLVRYAYQYSSGSIYSAFNNSDIIELTSSQFINSVVVHDQSGTITICPFDSLLKSRLIARYVAPPSGYSASLTLQVFT
jgi:hypothetical protein